MHWWLGYSPHHTRLSAFLQKMTIRELKKSAEIRLWLFLECPKRYTLCSYEMLEIITWQNQFDKIETGLWFRTWEFRGELSLQIWYIKWKSNQIFGFQDTVDLPAEHRDLLLNSTNTLYKKTLLGTAAKGGECRLVKHNRNNQP